MENGWLSFSTTYESFNHDLAIRKFCPARLEQEQGEEWVENETATIQVLSPSHDTFSTTSHLEDSQVVDELVDSFINIDDDANEHVAQWLSGGAKLPIGSRVWFPPLSVKENVDDEDAINLGTPLTVIEKSGKTQLQDFNHFQVEEASFDDVFVDVPMVMMHGSVPDFVDVPNNVVVDQGLHLVHLLLACAEAVSYRDTQLADSILAQIWSSTNPLGDSLQRVSYCFAAGLRCRLSHLQNVNANGTFNNSVMGVSLVAKEERMEAFHLFYQTTPYIAFGFMTANEAICQEAQGKDSIHVIDLGMEHTLQWPSFIRILASRPEGPPKLRITGLLIIQDHQDLLDLETRMSELATDAASLGIVLEFDIVSEPITPMLFTREKVRLREGEALFVNSIMHLHKFVKESRGSLQAILQAIKKLRPTLFTAVEQDANHNGPFFLGRFIESLHYYSAIFDSLEASLPRTSLQRMEIEKVVLDEEIRNIVAYEGCARIERHERADQWRRQMGRAGFHVMGLKCMSQARMMLSVYGCDGYTLSNEKGCLLLGWKGRSIMMASAWQVQNVPSS